MAITVERATLADIPRLTDLLLQVHAVHSAKRPDIFRRGAKKYTEEELAVIISDEDRPILVAKDDGYTVGYAFTVLSEIKDDKSLADRREMYLDDLCVDEKVRGGGVGRILYLAVKELARSLGCYHVTLNVWALNDGAMRFYEKMGLAPMKTYMEEIL